MTELDKLVSAARSLDEQPPPPDAGERMWAKIAAQAGGAAVLGMAAATIGAKTASASTAAASTAAVSTAAASTVATSSIVLTAAKVGLALAVTAGLSAGAVAVATAPTDAPVQARAVEPEPEPDLEPAAPRRAPSIDAPAAEVLDTVVILDEADTPSIAPEAAEPKTAPKPRKRTRPEPEAPQVSSLAAESALLGKARVASSSGHSRAALAALREHAQQYPSGELSEVRQALEVRVLCDLGRIQAARKAADRFLARYKASALAGQVRSSCAYE